jgi:hypothetical protein
VELGQHPAQAEVHEPIELDPIEQARRDDDLHDWRYEVANGDTLLGFRDWVDARDAAIADDPYA